MVWWVEWQVSQNRYLSKNHTQVQTNAKRYSQTITSYGIRIVDTTSSKFPLPDEHRFIKVSYLPSNANVPIVVFVASLQILFRDNYWQGMKIQCLQIFTIDDALPALPLSAFSICFFRVPYILSTSATLISSVEWTMVSSPLPCTKNMSVHIGIPSQL